MSAGDRAVLAHQIREAWGGPANGDGGTTDALIKIAVQIADDYYSRQAARTALAIPRTTVEPWDGVPGSEDDLIRRGE